MPDVSEIISIYQAAPVKPELPILPPAFLLLVLISLVNQLLLNCLIRCFLQYEGTVLCWASLDGLLGPLEHVHHLFNQLNLIVDNGLSLCSVDNAHILFK